MWTFEEITKHLNCRSIQFEEVVFSDVAVSARKSDTSVTNNYNPDNAIKTLLVKGKAGVVGVILKADDKVDSDKLKALIGKWSVVSSDELKRDYGLITGGINPFVLDVPVYVDKYVLGLKVISMGAGSITKGINVNLDNLKNNLDFKVVEIRKVN